MVLVKYCDRNPNIFLFYTIILSLLTLQAEVDTAKSDEKQGPGSPSPAAPVAKGQGQDAVVLPPSLTPVPGRPKHHQDLKSLMNRKKPLYEDFLDSSQMRVLEAAVKTFGLYYSVFPVKRESGYDINSSPEIDEVDQVRAFELLSGIVGRSVRDAVVCSSDKENSAAREVINCDPSDDMIIRFSEDVENGVDDLCSPNDPENALSEECLMKKEGRKPLSPVKVVRGPALDFTITAFSTSLPGYYIRLPPNGALKEALERKLWKVDSPTKIILTLAPSEFLIAPHFLEKLNRKMISGTHNEYNMSLSFTKTYGSNEIHNIVRVEWPEIFAKRVSITQLALRLLATAEKLARIILRWHRKEQIKLDQIHFIGTSLGAHLAGIVANIIKEKAENQQVARITGLDPLGWGFDEMDGIGIGSELELSNDDAIFVDVIHTSSSDPHYPFIHYGSNEQRGTADFYPNNGRAQYCGRTDGLCHHFYSVILYTASISGANFNGCKCSSWDEFIMERKCMPCVDSAKMGEHVDTGQANGVYYLATA